MPTELKENEKIQAAISKPNLSSGISCAGNGDREDETQAEIIEFLVKIISLKTSYFADHSNNVKNLTLELAVRVGFQTDKLKYLGYAAMLHDIGKLVISECIVDKPAPLTEVEFLQMKQHVSFGHQVIQPLHLDPVIGDVILYHHESFDGSGYLSGLRGDEIPLVARIVKITDTYDALTSNRPYRAAYRHTQAVEILKEERRHFDPFLLDAFLELLDPTPLA